MGSIKGTDLKPAAWKILHIHPPGWPPHNSRSEPSLPPHKVSLRVPTPNNSIQHGTFVSSFFCSALSLWGFPAFSCVTGVFFSIVIAVYIPLHVFLSVDCLFLLFCGCFLAILYFMPCLGSLPRLNPCPLQWRLGALTTGMPPGMPHFYS